MTEAINAESAATPMFIGRRLAKVYRSGEQQVQALRGVDLEIYRGEFVVLLGPSGSGKSTLLNILGGLDTPTSGEARWGDHDLAAADEAGRTRFRREHVGFVFQFYNLIPSLTARENVVLVTELTRNSMPAEEALERVGLASRMDHFPSQLSGGEAERYSVAALAIDSTRRADLPARIKELPKVSTGIIKDSLLETFRNTTARNMLFFTGVLTVFAATIAIGIVYNSARISLAERAWELASLRVLGMTRGEVSAKVIVFPGDTVRDGLRIEPRSAR